MIDDPSGGVLSGQEIRELQLIAVDSFEESCCQDASYDLRLGEAHYVYGENGDISDATGRKWKLYYIGEVDKRAHKKKAEDFSEPSGNRCLTIPPYGSAIIQLLETIDTYSLLKTNSFVVGRFDLKLSQVYQALISQQATQVEPGYIGKLFCFVHNLSNKPIELKYRDKIATIEFSRISSNCKDYEKWASGIINTIDKKNARKYIGSAYAQANGINDIRWFAENNRLPEECGLANVINSVNSKIQDNRNEINSYFDTYDNVERISKKVQSHIDSQSKLINSIVSLFITIASAGVLTLLTMFKTELNMLGAKISALQSQLPGLTIDNSNIVFNQLTLGQFLCVVVCIVAIVIFAIILWVVSCYSRYITPKKGAYDDIIKAQKKLEQEYNKLQVQLNETRQQYDKMIKNGLIVVVEEIGVSEPKR